MKQANLAWRGEDDAARFDRATVRFDDRGMVAHGTSITDAYALSWSLDATDHWRTLTLGVTVYGDGWWRSVFLVSQCRITTVVLESGTGLPVQRMWRPLPGDLRDGVHNGR